MPESLKEGDYSAAYSAVVQRAERAEQRLAELEKSVGDEEVQELSKRLSGLCHPFAEAMSDRARLDAFVKAGSEAAALLQRLHTRAAKMTTERNSYKINATVYQQRAEFATARAERLAKALEPFSQLTRSVGAVSLQNIEDARAAHYAFLEEHKPLEVRLNPDGSLDEVVASNAFVHLEQMAGNAWWMSVRCGSQEIHVWFRSRANVKVSYENEGTAPAKVVGGPQEGRIK